jgi:hypothetical protein
MWRLPADFWTAIEEGITHLSQDTQETTTPTLPFPNISHSNQKPPLYGLQRTKFNQVDEYPQGTSVIQVAEIFHGSPLLKIDSRMGPRVRPSIHHFNVGSLTTNMAILQQCLSWRHKGTLQTVKTR